MTKGLDLRVWGLAPLGFAAAVRLFDLERDVIGSCELQSRWSLFIAHLNLCPLSFKRNVSQVEFIYGILNSKAQHIACICPKEVSRVCLVSLKIMCFTLGFMFKYAKNYIFLSTQVCIYIFM